MIDFFSVEKVPGMNASAAFLPVARQTFREDSDFVEAVTPCGKRYIPWGADDNMPYDIIDMIESDETLSTCQIWNAEMCYGEGIVYCTEKSTAKTAEDVENFFWNNDMPQFFLGACQDIKHFSFAVALISLNQDASKIVSISRLQACYCRFTKADKYGKIPSVIYGNFRQPSPSDTFAEFPLLDPLNPWLDLSIRTGRAADAAGNIKKSSKRTFAVLAKFPGVDSLYYPIPHYASLFRSSWYNIKRLIGIAKEAKLKNAAPIKYIIEVSQRYWDEMFKTARATTEKEKAKLIRARKEEMMSFLTTTENSGAILFTNKGLSVSGAEEPLVTVKSIDSKTKEGGDWSADIAEAVNMICFTMHVHSNLVGSVPGKSQTNNSGSDKRELYTIAQALQKPYHDILFQVHKIIIRFNGWKNVYPVCPFIQLTTLDEHRDAKEVKID